MVFNSNTLITVTERDADGTTLYGHVFEDKGRKIIVKFNLDESRCDSAFPAEPESQLELPPKEHTETRTELGLGLQCEQQSEVEDELQSKPQPKIRQDPFHEQTKHAAEEAVKIESIRDRLGASVAYLEGLLGISDVMKDVSRSFRTRLPTDHKYCRRSTLPLAFP